MAEKEGFEPTEPRGSDALQAPAFDHSATSPHTTADIISQLFRIAIPVNRFFAGGEGGIRTHGAASRPIDFESIPFDHSGTSPHGKVLYTFISGLPSMPAAFFPAVFPGNPRRERGGKEN